MRVSYDDEVDAAYIRFSNRKPDGAVEVKEGIALDTTADGWIVGIEIRNASRKVGLRSLFTLSARRSSA